MFFTRLDRAALIALALSACGGAHAATTAINVGVAANFSGTMASIVAAFKAQYPTANITYTVDSSSNLQSAIIAGTTKYDLFLSADTSRPWDLWYKYNSLVTSQPFFYAYGTLELWSASTANNVSAGLPATPQKFVIADPNKAPYGFAAGQVIQQRNYATCASTPTAIPGGGATNPEYLTNTCSSLSSIYVATAANIGTTYSAIKSGAYPYGFVAQSQICTLKNNVKTFSAGTHRSYAYNDPSFSYLRIKQDGIKIKNAGRSAAQETVLTNFVSFLQSAAGQSIIKSYCYDLS